MEDRRLLTAANVLSYHNDAASTGANLAESVLNPVNVNASSFGKFFTTVVDGQVYAQPLYASGINITSGAQQGVHSVVYVATQNDSLYAIDAGTGAILWQDSFLVPEAALSTGGNTVTVSTVSSTDINSNDITPQIGITATPAIDLSNGFLYLTAKTKQIVNGNSSNPHFVYTLYKVSVQSGAFTGAVIGDTSFQTSSSAYTFNSGPSVADPNGNGDGVVNVGGQNLIIFNAMRQLSRAAITLNNGSVYIAFASHGDNVPYHGWILGYDENTLNATAAFCANPDGDDCGIWQGGGKIAIDPQGFMYVQTGNGKFDTTLNAQGFPINGDYGDSFLKLAVDPSSTSSNPNINGWGLKVIDYFTPMVQSSLNSTDQDLGSGGPLILPETAGTVTIGSASHSDLLVGAGKQGIIYLIDRNNMGHYSSTTDQVVQELSTLTGAGGSYNTPAFFFDGSSARFYYIGSNDNAFSFSVSNATMSVSSASNDSYGPREGSISISADGTANGITWNIDVVSGQLRAYSASNLTQQLWTSAQASGGRDALGTAVKFSSPTIANGQVFVGNTTSLVAYGIFAPPTSAPAAPTNLAAAAVSGVQVNLTWQDQSNNESGFAIEQSTDNGSTFTQVGVASVSTTSYSVTGLTPGGEYVFRVRAFNSAGNSAYTNTASATTPTPSPVISFPNGFSNAASQLQFNGSASINSPNLQLTDGGTSEASSAFYNSAVSITGFSTTFSFQFTNPVAEGLTFTLQRTGPTALGASGGGLGYSGIATSAAIKFDIFSDAGEGTDSTGLFTGGANPSVTSGSFDMSASGVVLRSGDIMQVTLHYDGANLQETITDTTTHAGFSKTYTINFPATLGGSTAYTGFTGSTGSSTSTQKILSWNYTPLPAPPVMPTNLAVTPASGTELDLSWTQNSSPVDHFNILRQNAQAAYVQIAQVPGSATSYPDSGLTPGTTYSYEVVAGNAGGDSSPAGPVGGTTPVPPAPPSNLQASNITSTGVTLTWQDNANNEDGYKISRQLESNSSIQLLPLRANSTTFTDSGLIPGSVYQYIVDAYNIAGPSTGISVVIITIPSAPTNVSAVASVGRVQLNWTAPKGAASYNIFRGNMSGGENPIPIATGIASPTFTDTSITNGSHYYYQVTAIDASGQSALSTEASTSTSGTLLNGTAASDNITLSPDPDHQHIDWSMGAASGQVLATDAAGLEINGNGGNDTVTFNNTGGNPVPARLKLNGIFTLRGLQTLNGSTLDIGQSTVFISYSGSDPIASIKNYLSNGLNGGGWNGTPTMSTGVITSSAAMNNPSQTTAVGYVDSADGLITGQPFNTIELKYTLYGDTTLTGSAGFNDFTRLTQHYNQTSGGAWDTGDFNYDGSVNAADFTLLARTYGTTLGSAAVIAFTSSSQTLTLTQDADHQHIDWTLGPAHGQVLMNDPNGLTIFGDGSNDPITFNYAGGNPLPARLNLEGTFTLFGLQNLTGVTLDINRSTVYVNYAGNADPLNLIRSYLRTGYDGGLWNGAATLTTGSIISSAAAANALQTTGIGYADSADGLIAGQPANTIELKYTLYGDTTLTGSVSFNDFTRLTQHYNQTIGAAWDTGDFNYDASVNTADFTLLSRTYNTGLGLQAQPAVTSASSITGDPTTIKRRTTVPKRHR